MHLVGKLPGSRIISAKGSRRGSVTLDSREEVEVSGTATPRETEEAKTARVSFDAMKYATQVEDRIVAVSSYIQWKPLNRDASGVGILSRLSGSPD